MKNTELEEALDTVKEAVRKDEHFGTDAAWATILLELVKVTTLPDQLAQAQQERERMNTAIANALGTKWTHLADAVLLIKHDRHKLSQIEAALQILANGDFHLEEYEGCQCAEHFAQCLLVILTGKNKEGLSKTEIDWVHKKLIKVMEKP